MLPNLGLALSNVAVLAILLAILALPFIRFFFTRQPEERFGQWGVRTEYEQTKALGKRMRQASWLSPQSFAYYLFCVGRVTFGIFWLTAGVILLGDFINSSWSWQQIPSALWLLGAGIEALLMLGVLGVWLAYDSARPAQEEIRWAKLMTHWAYVWAYTFCLVQGLAYFVKEPDIFFFRMMVVGKQLKSNETVEQGIARMKNATEEDVDRWIETKNMPRGFTWQWEPRKATPEVLAELKARYQGQAIPPEMERLFGGEFHMGCHAVNEERKLPQFDLSLYGKPKHATACPYNELPYHLEQVKSFEIGKFEVTFDEWDACVADGGCEHWPDDHQHGRGKYPVTDVSFDDVQQYLGWLNRKTGRNYRLPTEIEWEYAARSGMAGAFQSGKCLSKEVANYSGKPQDFSSCPEEKPSSGPMPLGSLKPSAWRLFDMHGNVAEWVSDCRSGGYDKDRYDAGCRIEVDRKRRGVRGGSWKGSAENARFAHRSFLRRDARVETVGFRVVLGP